MPGAAGGVWNKITRDPERGYERHRRTVPSTYEQDIMPYSPGYWTNYGWQTVVALGVMVGLMLPVYPLARYLLAQQYPHTLGPLVMLVLLLVPQVALLRLVVRWYRLHRHAQGLLDVTREEQTLRAAERGEEGGHEVREVAEPSDWVLEFSEERVVETQASHT